LTNPTLDLAQLAQSAGIASANNVATPKDFASALSTAFAANRLQVLVLSTEPDVDVVRPPISFDPVLTKHRFMTAVGAPRYIPTMFGGGRLESE
jgi:thiamine pyrophosphate-dependent acetolactate synthase large subunit-like protein